MKERHKVIPASYLILKKDDQILLSRRFNTGYFDGWYGVPAGHIELGEQPTECIIREAQEEIGILLSKEEIELVHTMYRIQDKEENRVDFFFLAEKWSGEIKNMEPNKCDDIRWYPLSNLPENLTPHTRVAITALQNGEISSELPFSEEFRDPNAVK
jgi:mutator protein MutT